MNKLPERIRIKDIARLADVSVGTVDRVIHGRSGVSEASKKRVEEILKQLDYQPNMYASALASNKKYTFICLLPEHLEGLPGLNDSKQLTAAKREALFAALLERADVHCSVGIASTEEIDRLNILRATHLAMARAVEGLSLRPDFCLVDGLPVKGMPVPHRAIVKGDGRSLSIAAASVLAKVTRDRMMTEADAEFPQYGFAKHKGYGTKVHMEALRKHGPCPLHRRSFAPVSQMELSLPE